MGTYLGEMLPTDDHESGLFNSIAGLPLHPLVVHLAVVVLPASAIALIAIIAVPRWRRPYGWLTVAAALLGALGAFVAKESGEALAEQVGLPADHAEWGDRLFVAAFVFAVVTVVWFALELLGRRTHPTDAVPASEAGGSPAPHGRGAKSAMNASSSGLARVAGAAVVVVSLVVLALTVVVGHSGATAVWGGKRLAPVSASAAQGDAGVTAGTPRAASTTPSSREQSQRTPTSSASATTRPPTTGPAAFSLADVGRHQSGSSCWAAINGGVYDLTQWINDHPGGSDVILGICGTDASAAFNAQHGGQGKPARELAAFKIGVLR